MINAASSGDEVWVATGTYLPTRDITGNTSPAEPRDKTFFIDKDIEIYGGFPGTGNPTMPDRDWKTYHTILSGDLNGDDAPGLSGSDLFSHPSRGDNANSVVFTKNVSSAFVMDGLLTAEVQVLTPLLVIQFTPTAFSGRVLLLTPGLFFIT